MMRTTAALSLGCLISTSALPVFAQAFMKSKTPKPVTVLTAPDKTAKAQPFHDGKYGVRFQVPPGWIFTRKDGEVSTFHLDARTAPPKAEMRGVASLGFNPFPQTVLSGATFYYSVEKHSNDAECANQAALPGAGIDSQDIGGMEFRHAHDEHGQICVEARDEVYTAYRKGACYRFDLETNTFCAISSGAQELTESQFTDVERQMTNILSSVVLDWRKEGAQRVPVPAIVKKPLRPEPELKVRPHPPQVQSGQ
jgi:hypothetical protein